MKQLMILPGEKAVCTGTVVTTTTRVPKQSRDVELWAEGPHDTRILRIIGIILRSGVLIDGHVEVTLEGTVQGSPLSPLLSSHS